MTEGKHAFVVAGTQSGCGKTSISLALMAAFRARGLRVQPFKVGPDFIDPGLHTLISGQESRNLDGWMLQRDYNRSLFQRLLSGSDLAVVEGVMGLYDGYDGNSEAGSSAQMAKWLGLPVVLVVDARSMARSAAALVHGFSSFDPDLRTAAVIFNRIGSPGHLDYLKDAMAATLPDITVLGGIPRNDGVTIPERHLGLVTADELRLSDDWRDAMVRMVEERLDLDLLLQKASYAGALLSPSGASEGQWPGNDARRDERRGIADVPGAADAPVIIAVPRDAAFCFYYPDNLELLRMAGARLHFFSPLAGETFPENASGLYIGGGYPEVHAAPLAESLAGGFLDGVRTAAAGTMPIYAECGGLMSLGRFIETVDGSRYPMAGVLPFGTRMLKRRKALGYTEVELQRSCLLGPAGLRLRGHEFHYSEIVEQDGEALLERIYAIQARKGAESMPEGYAAGSVLASYVHLHWGSAPEAARNFVASCREYMMRQSVRSTVADREHHAGNPDCGSAKPGPAVERKDVG